MKPALILRTYTWLYYTIREFGPLTFNEINKMWKEEERLSEGNSMVRQTFARHRSDLEEILGVRISCDKRHRYYIKNDSLSYQNDRTILLNAAINQMLNSTEVRDDDRWTACGNKHLMTVSLCLRQSQNGRGRNLVCLKTHQCPVDIEK